MYGSLSILCRNFTRYHDPYLFSLYPHHVQGPSHNRTDLFLDGSGSLDSATSQDVLGLLKVSGERFSQTIVMITHNEEIAQLADRIVRIEDGKIISGTRRTPVQTLAARKKSSGGGFPEQKGKGGAYYG